jgi:hypothetical protein
MALFAARSTHHGQRRQRSSIIIASRTPPPARRPTAPCSTPLAPRTSLLTTSSRLAKAARLACKRFGVTSSTAWMTCYLNPVWTTNETKPCPSRNCSPAMGAGAHESSSSAGLLTQPARPSSYQPTGSKPSTPSSRNCRASGASVQRSGAASLAGSASSPPPSPAPLACSAHCKSPKTKPPTIGCASPPLCAATLTLSAAWPPAYAPAPPTLRS